jgi:KaiC/GvpD/RAD55 family RecA-like ATPase
MNKFAEKLRNLSCAIKERQDPFAPSNLLRSSSPGVNWMFGNTHGFPFGYSMLLWGEKKSGKSLLSYVFAGQLHRDDPDALVIKFDTEMRDRVQLTPQMMESYGIQEERFIVYETNKPEDIFDRLSDKGEVTEMLQQGAKIKLIIIDSISEIQGSREAKQDSVLNLS